MTEIYLGPNLKWASSVVALGALRDAKLVQELLLGIYEQLIENAPEEAKLATEHIRAHRRKYSGPVRKLAETQFELATKGPQTSGARLTEWPEGAEILQTRDDVFFDGSVFEKTCAELCRREEGRTWLQKITDGSTPMQRVVMLVPDFIREPWAKKYVANFDQAFAP